MSRTRVYRSIAVASWWSDKALRDDGKITTEDIDETIFAAAGLALIWRGDILLAQIPGIQIVEGIIVAGGVIAYSINGVEGVLDYADFISAGPSEWKRITMEETLPIIYEEVIKPEVVDPVTEFVETKIDQGLGFGKMLYRESERRLNEGLEWAVGNLRNPFGIY